MGNSNNHEQHRNGNTCNSSKFSSPPPSTSTLAFNSNIDKHSHSHSASKSKSKSKSSSSSSFLSLQKREKTEHRECEEWFIRYQKMYKISHNVDFSKLDHRRIVFISINGLFKSWQLCPPQLLYNAIFILPLKKIWIQNTNKYNHDYNHLLNDAQFLMLIKWKMSQKLVFFMADNDEENEWRKISMTLSSLYDAINRRKYNELYLTENYWKYSSSVSIDRNKKKEWFKQIGHDSLYSISYKDVLSQIYSPHHSNFNFKAIKQILIESNSTLNVVTHRYTTNNNEEMHISYNNVSGHHLRCMIQHENEMNIDNDTNGANDEWCVADDYFDDDDEPSNNTALNEFFSFLNTESNDDDDNKYNDVSVNNNNNNHIQIIQRRIVLLPPIPIHMYHQNGNMNMNTNVINNNYGYAGTHHSSYVVADQRYNPMAMYVMSNVNNMNMNNINMCNIVNNHILK